MSYNGVLYRERLSNGKTDFRVLFFGLGPRKLTFFHWGFNNCTLHGLLKLHYLKLNECSIRRPLSLYHISLSSPLNHSQSTPHPPCIFYE